jgi:hypothetical protein
MPFGTRLVPAFNSFQTGASLYEMGLLDATGLPEIAAALAEQSGYTRERMRNSLDDLLRRGHLREETRTRVLQVLDRAEPSRRAGGSAWASGLRVRLDRWRERRAEARRKPGAIPRPLDRRLRRDPPRLVASRPALALAARPDDQAATADFEQPEALVVADLRPQDRELLAQVLDARTRPATCRSRARFSATKRVTTSIDTASTPAHVDRDALVAGLQGLLDALHQAARTAQIEGALDVDDQRAQAHVAGRLGAQPGATRRLGEALAGGGGGREQVARAHARRAIESAQQRHGLRVATLRERGGTSGVGCIRPAARERACPRARGRDARWRGAG